jgi:hypothetical protein
MDIDSIANNILSFDDDMEGNVQIKPQIYIHNNLLMAQRVLLISVLKNNLKEGLLAYRMFIESIESLMRSAGWIDENSIKVELKDLPSNEIAREGAIANKKLELLMTQAFKRSQIYGSVTLKNKKNEKENEEIEEEN